MTWDDAHKMARELAAANGCEYEVVESTPTNATPKGRALDGYFVKRVKR